MKRYIRASISPSAPDWLKKGLTRRYGNELRDRLLKKANIAIEKANFSHERPEGARVLPIYFLETDYSNVPYAPGMNDSEEVVINGRNRKLGSIAKSKLPEMAIDVVYVDLDDPENTFEPKKERYKDPRYSYDFDRGEYAGQYKKRDYLGHDEYSDEYWSSTGRTPRRERRARDKSGYRIPDPSEMIGEYYTRFPEKITDKIDAVYDRMLEVRQELMDADFNIVDTGYDSSLENAYADFGRAVRAYKDILRTAAKIKKDPSDFSFYQQGLVRTIDEVKAELASIEKYLGIQK